MATATRDERTGRITLTLGRREAEVLRALAGHLSFASIGTNEASAVFHALCGARVERAYGVDISKSPSGSFHLVEA